MQIRSSAVVLAALGLLSPSIATAEPSAPLEQDFVITAYYSPLPDQCCYVKGSEEADKELNGHGTHGADGTPVYPGMVAAPSTYAFGTRIELPGIGTFTVHDRGGAIIEGETTHRLDLWVGHGEEGLARALAFGVQRVRGTVYPKGSDAPAESFALASLPAPEDRLEPYTIEVAAFPAVKEQQAGLSVRLLQEGLKGLGYFTEQATGFFGEKTRASLAAFIADAGLSEPTDAVTPLTAAYLEAVSLMPNREEMLAFIGPDSPEADVASARRVLRLLGYYRGRTNGPYDHKTRDAIMAFQKEHRLIAGATSPGAGRVGPLTRKKLASLWRMKLAALHANSILERRDVQRTLAERGLLLAGFLSEGMNGDGVRVLQRMLVERGLLASDAVTGQFGPRTKEALLQYQLASGIVKTVGDVGAGRVGPLTLRTITEEQVKRWHAKVQAQGWSVL